MTQFTIGDPAKRNVKVAIQEYGYSKSVDARLYVGGDIATLTAWTGKTEAGARRWANKVLAAN